MTARPVRVVLVVVLAVAATWFVARPAFGSAVAWRTVIGDGPSDLAADADGVVVTSNAQSVHLLDRRGRVVWRAAPVDVGRGRPALGAHVVVVGGASVVTALSRTDGTVRWRVPVTEALSVAVADGTALIGDDSGTLRALDARSGATRWSVQYPGSPWSAARVDAASRSVVVTWHGGDAPAARVLDLDTGALRWEAPTARYTAAPAVHGGRVVLAIGDGYRHARVEARDLRTGDVLWQAAVPASFEEAIEPAVDDHPVAVVDHFGVVTLLDPRTGRIRWQHDLADVLLGTRVVLTRTRVAFTSYAGNLHVLDRRDGHVVQTVGSRELGGLAVNTAQRGRGVLLALRLRDWAVQLRRLG